MKSLEEMVLEGIDDHERWAREYGAHDSGLDRRSRADAWGRYVAQAAELALVEIATACAHVNSPIEERFLCALWVAPGFGFRNFDVVDNKGVVQARQRDSSPEDHLKIEPQAAVGAYRADFLLTKTWVPQSTSVRVAVELDGHDFHEKTKKQAAHDKKRGRFFAAQGLHVLRFTGSEIHRDVDACVREVMWFLTNAMRDALGRT